MGTQSEEDKKKLGRYKRIWHVLRETSFMTINLQIAETASDSQRAAVAKTIIKAVIKEKHEDMVFRRANPNCRLKTEFTVRDSKGKSCIRFSFEGIKGMELDSLKSIDFNSI